MDFCIKLVTFSFFLHVVMGDDLRTRMDSLELQLKQTTARIEQLVVENEHKGKQLENLSKELIHTKLQLKQMESSTKVKIYDFYRQMQDEKKNCNNLYDDGNFVSFLAQANTDRTYAVGDAVLYDSVINNYGSAYDPESSTFVCPVNGYYMFAFSIRSTDDRSMHAYIYQEANVLGGAVAHAYYTASVTVTTHCKAGESVSVKCSYGDNNYMEGGSYSIFTGALLSIS